MNTKRFRELLKDSRKDLALDVMAMEEQVKLFKESYRRFDQLVDNLITKVEKGDAEEFLDLIYLLKATVEEMEEDSV